MKSTGDAALDEMVGSWMKWDQDESTKGEIQRLVEAGKVKELQARLMGRMSFGTAGLRARMEAGFARMNALTIIQTCQGLVTYLLANVERATERGVAIGFDGRHNSKRFAHLAAGIFARKGVKVYLFSKVVPTPYVSYSVSEYGCAGGVMVTASHNPKEDNGYKAYWHTGAQLLIPHDKNILAEIRNQLEPWAGSWDGVSGDVAALVSDPLATIAPRYLDVHSTPAHCFHRDVNAGSSLRVVYSAFHGVGGEYTPEMIRRFGFPGESVVVVREQQEPDGDFPTITGFPNPEEGASVLGLPFKTADEKDATLVLVNDPDADRLQMAQKIE